MKLKLILSSIILMATTNLQAATLTTNCETMNEIVSSLTTNLLLSNKNSMDFIYSLETNGIKTNTKEYNESIKGMAEAIDTLQALINKDCK